MVFASIHKKFNMGEELKKEKLTYYRVELNHTMYKFCGNQWNPEWREEVENKGTYYFKSKENAEKHLESFIMSRRANENWLPVERKYPVLSSYIFTNGYGTFKWEAHLSEIKVKFNDSFFDDHENNRINLILDAIDHAYLQTDGTYGDLSMEVVDKVNYLKHFRTQNK